MVRDSIQSQFQMNFNCFQLAFEKLIFRRETAIPIFKSLLKTRWESLLRPNLIYAKRRLNKSYVCCHIFGLSWLKAAATFSEANWEVIFRSRQDCTSCSSLASWGSSLSKFSRAEENFSLGLWNISRWWEKKLFQASSSLILEPKEKKTRIKQVLGGGSFFFDPQLPLALFFWLPENLMKKKKSSHKGKLACISQINQGLEHACNRNFSHFHTLWFCGEKKRWEFWILKGFLALVTDLTFNIARFPP